MSKAFTCRELGGVCDEAFSGDSVERIMQAAMPHMMSDTAHTESVMTLSARTGETQAQWMDRIRVEFEAKPEDH